MNINIRLSVEDYTIIINALHYYKKAEKRGNFKRYDVPRINQLRDELASQFMKGFTEPAITQGDESKLSSAIGSKPSCDETDNGGS